MPDAGGNGFPLILALDLARVTGIAIGRHGEKPRLDAVELPSQARDGIGAMMAALIDELDDLHKEFGFTRICTEEPLIQGSGMARVKQAVSLQGAVELWCYRKVVQCRQAPASTARLHVMGRGTFPKGTAKEHVTAWCRAQGWDFPDDNAADAGIIWAYAASHMGGGTGA